MYIDTPVKAGVFFDIFRKNGSKMNVVI